MLNYLLSYDVWQDGPLAALDRLNQPELRHAFRRSLPAWRLDLDHIRIAWLPGRDNRRYLGSTLAQYVAEQKKPPEDALFDLLIEERLAVLCVMDEGDDALVHPMLRHERYMMGSDGIFFPDAHVHPRAFGSAGRLLGPCVRDARLFSLEEAVQKLTSRAAQRFGLAGRGQLAEGSFADVVVFDPDTVTDRATFDEPNRYTTGIELVLVNGTAVVQDGKPVETFSTRPPGRYLKRGV